MGVRRADLERGDAQPVAPLLRQVDDETGLGEHGEQVVRGRAGQVEVRRDPAGRQRAGVPGEVGQDALGSALRPAPASRRSPEDPMYGALTREQYLASTARDTAAMAERAGEPPAGHRRCRPARAGTSATSAATWASCTAGRWTRCTSSTPPDEGAPPAPRRARRLVRRERRRAARRAAGRRPGRARAGASARTRARSGSGSAARRTRRRSTPGTPRNAIGRPPADRRRPRRRRRRRGGRDVLPAPGAARAPRAAGRRAGVHGDRRRAPPRVLGEGEPVATLSGPAESLLLGLWRRRDLGRAAGRRPACRSTATSAAARAVLVQQLTP